MRFILTLFLAFSAINIAAATSCMMCNGGCLPALSYDSTLSYYFNSTDSMCYRCPGGCLTCDNPNTCSVCNDGYILTSNKTCRPCLNFAGCRTCDTSTLTCSTCLDGYYMDDSGACRQCSWSCMRCTSTSSCSSCTPPFYQPYQPDYNNYYGYYLDSSNSCQSSSVTGCSLFSSDGTCLACLPGFAFSSDTCNKCPLYCVECDAAGTTCTKCSATYAYYDQSLSKCELCSSNCKTCTSGNNCLECEVGFAINQTVDVVLAVLVIATNVSLTAQ